MEGLVSIIVLTYRKFDNLEKNINSIYKQTYSKIELIISDDGSENFNKGYIEDLLKNKPDNIKKISIIENKKNIGTVKNFNNAIKKSKGDYIFPLAQDDTFYSNTTVDEIVKEFKENLIVTGIREVKVGKEVTIYKEYPLVKDRLRFKTSNFYRFLIYNGNIISGASTYYRRKIFEKYGYFDEDFILLEDAPFYFKILRNKEKIKLIKNKVIKYKLDGVSDSKNKNSILECDVKLFYEKEIPYNKGIDKRYLSFQMERKKNICEKKNKYLIYLKFPDLFFINILNIILKKNLYLKLLKI